MTGSGQAKPVRCIQYKHCLATTVSPVAPVQVDLLPILRLRARRRVVRVVAGGGSSQAGHSPSVRHLRRTTRVVVRPYGACPGLVKVDMATAATVDRSRVVSAGGSYSRSATWTEKKNTMIERKAALLASGAVLIAGPALGDADCKHKGATYSHGSAVCQSVTAATTGNGAGWQSPAWRVCPFVPRAARSTGSRTPPVQPVANRGHQYRCGHGRDGVNRLQVRYHLPLRGRRMAQPRDHLSIEGVKSNGNPKRPTGRRSAHRVAVGAGLRRGAR